MTDQSKHTPGPWSIRPNPHDDWGWVRAASGDLVALARAGRDVPKYELEEHRRAKTDPYEHNTRLIAAAPDMLALIKVHVTCCPDCGGTGVCYTHEDETQVGCAPGSSGIDCPGCAADRAIVAKVEGRR